MPIRVRVIKENLDGAIRTMARRLKEEGVPKKLREKKYYIPPSEHRRADKENADYATKMKRVFSNLKIIFQKRGRGF